MSENFIAGYAAANLIARRQVKGGDAQQRIAIMGALLPMPIGLIVAQQLSNVEAEAEARRAATATGDKSNGDPPAAEAGQGSSAAPGSSTPAAAELQPDPSSQAVEQLARSAERAVDVIEAGGKRLLGSLEKIADGLENGRRMLSATATADAPPAAEAAPAKAK
jgi:hypothetical protein